MSAFKVSLSFLEGPVSGIIDKSALIAKSMSNNVNFPVPPISPSGLQDAVDHLKAMQKKVKTGNGKSALHRDEALADVDDYIRQQAEYVNHASYYDLEKLQSSGFDMLVEEKLTPVPEKVTTLTLRNGKRAGEVIALIDLVQHCKVAVGRVSNSPQFPAESTTEVPGSSRTRVFFSALIRSSEVWISVKCRGNNGDSAWSEPQKILVK